MHFTFWTILTNCIFLTMFRTSISSILLALICAGLAWSSAEVQDSSDSENVKDILGESQFHQNAKEGKVDPESYFRASRGFLLRQRGILKAFRHYRCPSLAEHDDFYLLSQTYNPKDHLSNYTNPELVKKYVEELEAGKYMGRYDPFTFEPTPVAQFKDLTLILSDAFAKSADLFYKTLAYFFTRVNVSMLYTSISVIISSLRVEGYRLPPPYEALPNLYTPKDIIYQANEIDLLKAALKPVTLAPRNGLASPEEEMAYFRCDANINSFHYYWHVDFPSWFNQSVFGVHKDRKGELFLNAHHNIVARYMAERIALGFPPIEPLDIVKPLYPGVSPNVLEMNFEEFPPRGPGILIQDLPRAKTADVKMTENRLRQSLADGYFVAANGSQISVRNDGGSEILGNAIESNLESINIPFYGSFHNFDHLLISRTVDPDGQLKLPPGFILHQETTMNDPVFFKLHLVIDNINKIQHDYLTPYTQSQLAYPGVQLTGMNVQTNGIIAQNELQTFFRNVSWDVTNAISDMDHKCGKIQHAKVYSNVKQINHKEFQFKFNITSDKARTVLIRVFMAPSEFFNGTAPDLDTFRWSFFEMDKFPVNLTSGNNTIQRSSSDNSLAGAPYASWKSLYENVEIAYRTNKPLFVNKYARTCGWPRSYYLPRGRPEGMGYKLFAMVTDFEQDYNVDFNTAKRLQSVSMCTVPNGLDPDRKPMGFPFERRIESWEDFFQGNMMMIDVNLKHR